MVVFTCGHCGEAVQKPKVEKHYLSKCRNLNPNLSCMDCFKDFLGQEYQSHTKCITEEQRYGGKDFVAKDKKGEQKQNAWVEMVKTVLDEQRNMSKNVLHIIQTISQHTNTPRKKPKFVNFVKNVCGHKTNPNDINSAWELIAAKLPTLSQNQNQASAKLNESINNSVTESVKDLHIEETEKLTSKNSEQSDGKSEKGKSKKELKEEKKKKKYAAELHSAAQAVEEDVQEQVQSKKDKKKKNRTDSVTANDNQEQTDDKDDSKIKKRKRIDTVNSVHSDTVETEAQVAVQTTEIPQEPTAVTATQKTKKKKQKMEKNQQDESVCLHDQNVANSEQSVEKGDFDWHRVIMSVLSKKGNEIAFKRLQKKVLGEYSEMTGQDVDDRIAEKFIKKLKSAPNVRVDKNKVVLIE